MKILNGSEAYVVFGGVMALTDLKVRVFTLQFFTSAHSEDEAYGIGMRAIYKAFPIQNGFQSHNIKPVRIDDITVIDRFDINTLKEETL